MMSVFGERNKLNKGEIEDAHENDSYGNKALLGREDRVGYHSSSRTAFLTDEVNEILRKFSGLNTGAPPV